MPNLRTYTMRPKRLGGCSRTERSSVRDEEEAYYLSVEIARDAREERVQTDGRSAQRKRAKREAHLALKKY